MPEIIKRIEDTFEIKLYIGCRVGYHGKEIPKEELIECIGNFQSNYENHAPVRVTETQYVNQHYNEGGWEIGIINYPAKPMTKTQLEKFCSDLAVNLVESLKQQRISMVTKKKTIIFELKK